MIDEFDSSLSSLSVICSCNHVCFVQLLSFPLLHFSPFHLIPFKYWWTFKQYNYIFTLLLVSWKKHHEYYQDNVHHLAAQNQSCEQLKRCVIIILSEWISHESVSFPSLPAMVLFNLFPPFLYSLPCNCLSSWSSSWTSSSFFCR